MKGMSSAQDLVNVWNKFKSDSEPDLKVNWNFSDISDMRESHCVFIQNLRSLYNPSVPGHWVACVRVGFVYYYYDPFGTILTKRGVNKFKHGSYIYESIKKEQNFTGDNSDSCGYYCIFYLLNFIRRFKKRAYDYVVFNINNGKFVDTVPSDKKIYPNIEAMKIEIENNMKAIK